MIDTHEAFKMKDISGKNDLLIEVNWNPKDEKSNGCKVLKLTYPDKTTAYIKKEYLNSVLFAIGNEEEQRKMIPQIMRRVRWYETVLSVKATKDIRKGEQITFPIKLSLPSEEKEIIDSLKKKGDKLILPQKNY